MEIYSWSEPYIIGPKIIIMDGEKREEFSIMLLFQLCDVF